ncbi:MAG: PA14 domain-containing protein, partial [Planctomycetota bacterium]
MSKKLIYLIPFVLVPGLVGVAAGTEGLKGEYYHATISAHEWQDLVLARIDPDVNFDWGDQSPEQGVVNSDNFTVRWTGMIEAPNSETYTFHTEANDGVRLWINSELVIDTWTWNKKWQVTQPPIEDGSGNIILTAGQQYEIILEYYERGGTAMCKLSWSTPTLPREIIPNRYLSVERPNARNPEPADDDILRVALVTLLWTPGDYAASHDVYLGENFDDVDAGAADTFRGNQASTSFSIGFAGVPYPGGLVPGTTYYWRIDEVNDLHPNSPWKGLVRSFSIAPRTAYNPNPADGGEFVNQNVELGWEPGFGAMLHYVYFGDNFDDVNNAAGGLPQGTTTYTPGPLKLAKTYYWRVDEFNGLVKHKGDVWSFTTDGAVSSPEPSNGAVDVKRMPIFSWSPGIYAASHQVYLGADQEAVKNANAGSPEYKGTNNLGSESYDPGKLLLDTTYYWRIDQVNDVNPESPWTGHIWSFTTGNFLTVDDFEDYDDYSPDEIWNTWIDGFGT